MKFAVALAASIAVTSFALAQSPYAGMETRPVKALSQNEVADLTAGRGMGMALAAELNGYPGPSHVLEFGDKLSLSVDQRARIQRLFDTMKSEAIPLGQRLIAQESALDRQFAGRTITPENLKATTTEIGAIQAELRNTHLKYHLQTVEILSPEQIKRYSSLRGYGSADPMQHHHHNQ